MASRLGQTPPYVAMPISFPYLRMPVEPNLKFAKFSENRKFGVRWLETVSFQNPSAGAQRSHQDLSIDMHFVLIESIDTKLP